MMLLSQAALLLNGRLIGPDVRFSAVSTDSRRIMAGDLFIALKGEHYEGSDYVGTAMQAGAVAALVNQRTEDGRQKTEKNFAPCAPILLVENTRIALGQLAAHWRGQFNVSLVAVTGSNGKTTVKEMLACILRAAAGNEESVLATKGNLNNDIGMPLTLLLLKACHRYAVIEMGMNHSGEIDYLTHIASPDVALINNASDAHLEGLGTVEAVARAKGEIFAGLKQQGVAVFNADDGYAPLWRTLAGSHPMIEFGIDHQAEVAGQWQPQQSGLLLHVQTPSGNFSAAMQVHGAHNVRNALAATAAAIAMNVSVENIVTGLEKFGGVARRLQIKAARCGATLIDDTYNANPASVRAAIGVLAEAAGHRVLVLGDMGELGDDAAALHVGIGMAARRAGIEKLYTLGELSIGAANEFGFGARHFGRIEDLQQALEQELDQNTTVLVKGSRFMKMERVVEYLESANRSSAFSPTTPFNRAEAQTAKEKSCS